MNHRRRLTSGLIRLAAIATLLAGAGGACSDELSAPGVCPEFCPEGTLELLDTLVFSIDADSAFPGFVHAREATILQVVARGDTLTSRAILEFGSLPTGARLSNDLVDRSIESIDSLSLALTLIRRDPTAQRLRLKVYRLPSGRDSSETFEDLEPFFDDSTLLGDVVIDEALEIDTTLTDFAEGIVSVPISLATLETDSVLAVGVSVEADGGLAFVTVGSVEGFLDPVLTYFATVDSAGTEAVGRAAQRPEFDTFVYAPTRPALTELEVGGVPSARSLLRFTIPPFIIDTSRVVRATLILVPIEPVSGVPIDSFVVSAQTIGTDFGAKSPVISTTDSLNARLVPGRQDSVFLEITGAVERWRTNPDQPRALMLRVIPEAASFGLVRFGSSRSANFRPSVRLTYFSPIQFGTP